MERGIPAPYKKPSPLSSSSSQSSHSNEHRYFYDMLFINGFPKLLCLYIFVMTILIASLCLRAWRMRHKILEDCVAWLGMGTYQVISGARELLIPNSSCERRKIVRACIISLCPVYILLVNGTYHNIFSVTSQSVWMCGSVHWLWHRWNFITLIFAEQVFCRDVALVLVVTG